MADINDTTASVFFALEKTQKCDNAVTALLSWGPRAYDTL